MHASSSYASAAASAPRRTLWRAALIAAPLLLLGASAACSSSGDNNSNQSNQQSQLCSPGTNVVCRCANLEVGTKRCNADGSGYDTECMRNGSTQCPDGELPEPGGSSGGGGSGGSLNSCPGRLLALPEGHTIKLTGDTAGALDNHRGAPGQCAGTQGPAEHIYQLYIEPSTFGRLNISAKSNTDGYTPAVYLRRDDCGSGEQLACVLGDETTTTPVPVNGDHSYWLLVDGLAARTSNGKYEIELTLNRPEGSLCGDGVVQEGELCDDGNQIDGDGCNADCRGVDGNPPSATRCPGQPVHLWFNKNHGVTLRGSTSASDLPGAQNSFSTLSQNCMFAGDGTNTSNDHIYELIAHGSGNVLLELTPFGDFVPRVSLWSACNPSQESALVDCNYPAGNGKVELPSQATSSIHLEDGKRYTLVVDGHNSVGSYELTLVH